MSTIATTQSIDLAKPYNPPLLQELQTAWDDLAKAKATLAALEPVVAEHRSTVRRCESRAQCPFDALLRVNGYRHDDQFAFQTLIGPALDALNSGGAE